MKNSFPGDYYANARPEMVQFVPLEARRILEVGCGEGVFGNHLKKVRGAEFWGVEIFEKAALVAMGKLDKVLVGDIEGGTLSLPSKYFDCVIFNDSLEHLCDPWKALCRVKDYLKFDGTVVASIPNVRYLDTFLDFFLRKKWTYTEEGILDRTHLRFFTAESIKDLFMQCGYEIVRMEGINPTKCSWKFSLLNFISGNRFDDMRFLQYACVVKVSRSR